LEKEASSISEPWIRSALADFKSEAKFDGRRQPMTSLRPADELDSWQALKRQERNLSNMLESFNDLASRYSLFSGATLQKYAAIVPGLEEFYRNENDLREQSKFLRLVATVKAGGEPYASPSEWAEADKADVRQLSEHWGPIIAKTSREVAEFSPLLAAAKSRIEAEEAGLASKANEHDANEVQVFSPPDDATPSGKMFVNSASVPLIPRRA
jgi:hypothetical protein